MIWAVPIVAVSVVVLLIIAGIWARSIALHVANQEAIEAAKAFRDGGRDEAAEQEESEAALIDQYLPAQMDDNALDAVVASTIEEIGATGMSDMGKLMGAVMGKVKGEADGGRVQASVKAHLTGEKNA